MPCSELAINRQTLIPCYIAIYRSSQRSYQLPYQVEDYLKVIPQSPPPPSLPSPLLIEGLTVKGPNSQLGVLY